MHHLDKIGLNIDRLKRQKVTPSPEVTDDQIAEKAKSVGDAIKLMGFDDANQRNHAAISRYVARLILDAAPKGLMICGDTGTGKTLAMSIINEQLTRRKKPAGVVSAQFFANEVSNRGSCEVVAEYTAGLVSPIWRECYWDMDATTPVDLIIDDLGAETQAIHFGARTEALVELIAARYDHWHATGARTHFTTNLSSDDIGARYGKRIASRLREMCYTVAFSGNDRRAVQS